MHDGTVEKEKGDVCVKGKKKKALVLNDLSALLLKLTKDVAEKFKGAFSG